MENLMNLSGFPLFLAGTFMLICGLCECFAGFKILKGVLIAAGLYAGASAGWNLAGIIIQVVSGGASTVVQIVAAVIGALIISMLAFRFYIAGSFIINSFLIFILVYSICGIYGVPSAAGAVIGIAAGISAGLLCIKFFRCFIIVSASFAGSILIGLSVYAFLKNRYGFYANAVPAFVCFVSGIIVQLKTTKGFFSENKKTDV